MKQLAQSVNVFSNILLCYINFHWYLKSLQLDHKMIVRGQMS